MRKLILVTIFLLFSSTAQNAKAAPISFNEDFSNVASLPGPFLEQSVGGTPAIFDGTVARFPDLTPSWPPPGRSYLRTIDDNYNSVNFIAEITVTMFNGKFFDGGDGIVFFGMGVGEPNPSFFNEPSVTPSLYMRPAPDNWHLGLVSVHDNGLQTHSLSDLAGTGTHRLQMSWDAILQEMTFAIHKDFTGGPFVASSTFGTFDGSDNGFNATNSRIFFGGTSGTIFDDLTVQISPVPEPTIIPIDIKPKSCPNPLNVKSIGVLPVAILGTVDFDVRDIDIATLEINGVTPIKTAFEDITTPSALELCDCEALYGDTYEDLVLYFNTQDIVETLEDPQDGEQIQLTLKAMLNDGTEVEGTDCVLIKTKRSKFVRGTRSRR
jgi:hypothetical protein